MKTTVILGVWGQPEPEKLVGTALERFRAAWIVRERARVELLTEMATAAALAVEWPNATTCRVTGDREQICVWLKLADLYEYGRDCYSLRVPADAPERATWSCVWQEWTGLYRVAFVVTREDG